MKEISVLQVGGKPQMNILGKIHASCASIKDYVTARPLGTVTVPKWGNRSLTPMMEPVASL